MTADATTGVAKQDSSGGNHWPEAMTASKRKLPLGI
jgi:hypothetical protein